MCSWRCCLCARSFACVAPLEPTAVRVQLLDSMLTDHRQLIPCRHAMLALKSRTPRQAWRGRQFSALPRVSQNHIIQYALRRVFVSLCSQNLKREGFRGLTNPYCQLNVGRQGPFTTDVVFDSTNPCWKHKRQTFEFRVIKPPSVVFKSYL